MLTEKLAKQCGWRENGRYDAVDAVTEGDRIAALLVNFLEGPGLVYADYFIDCTGDALMFRQAGAPVSKYTEEDGMHKSMFFFVIPHKSVKLNIKQSIRY